MWFRMQGLFEETKESERILFWNKLKILLCNKCSKRLAKSYHMVDRLNCQQ